VDERMITLFSYIAEQVQNKRQLFDDEGMIMQALLNQGCLPQEVDAALTLMQRLVQIQDEESFGPDDSIDAPSMRTMNREERDRFTVDAFGLITKITNLGLISEDQREELLERAMNQYTDRIGIDHVKSVVAFALFANSREHDENGHAVGRRIRKTSWN
jgi:uncharacterized protein Smg (DUF494 family)